jgi:trimethylamine:corrinoid methyltransferase-like protein
MERGTRKAARSGEFYMPRLFDRHTYEAWIELGQPTMYSTAREQVRATLEGPLVDPLPDDVVGELDEILRTADRELTGASDEA